MASPRFRQIRDRLPSLWRPEEGDDKSLLARTLLAMADLLERLNGEASDVMQAHWFPYADRALFSPFYRRLREVQKKPLPKLGDPDLKDFPYIADLARLGALLPVLPWGGPPAQREKVEQYRKRIARTVGLYRNGLGTVNALAEMVLAQLPDDPDQPFTVEEFPSLPVPPRQAATRGAPEGVLGPLMRWQLENAGDRGLGSAAPTVYVQGMKEEGAGVAGPLIELYAAGSERIRLGIAYDGTLKMGETLRLRTAYSSWIGGEDGLLRALSAPGDSSPANPTAPGPWQAVPGAPAGTVSALLQGRDLTVWAALESDEGGALWRFDGETWTEALADLPRVLCLALDGDDLLAGTAKGLLRVPLHPNGALTPEPNPEDLNGPEVHAILRVKGGGLSLGTAVGLDQKDLTLPFEVAGPVHALYQDATGTVYFGTDLGLLQFQPGLNQGYWYSGESHSDQIPDWQPLTGEKKSAPAPDTVFLPPVRVIRRGPDSSLWLGTDHGIARYRARPAGGLAYTTLLEAFPDLASGRVFAIEEDARGTLWFATEQGLFRYDGRDWWQARKGEGDAVALVRLGPLEEPKQPVFWRFHDGSWERLDSAAKAPGWAPHIPAPVPAEPAIHTLLWTRQAVADLGTWDEGTSAFTRTGDAPGKLRARYKPDESRIVDGGLPAVPSLPPGRSVWRYLALESAAVPEPPGRPAWTVEGRFLPSPPDAGREAPLEGRYSQGSRHIKGRGRLDLSAFDEAVFAYPPEARVWFAWEERHAPAVLVRLQTTAPGEAIDPAVLDRVWKGIQQVRPAGVRTLLAVDEDIVRGA